MLIFSVLLTGVLMEFFNTTDRAFDNKLKAETQEQARVILDIIAFDLRMAGSGMPLGQPDFSPTDPTYGAAALPVYLDCTGNYLHFRMSERGEYTATSADYTPSGTDLDFDVAGTGIFEVGDILYISENIRA